MTTDLKIALTGTSGSGKTTLANFISQEFSLPFISGSSADVKGPDAETRLMDMFGVKTGLGHAEVIKNSATNFSFGYINQVMVREAREKLIRKNPRFVTDRSPLDNWTYFINQVGFHKELTPIMQETFKEDCIRTMNELDVLIYIRPVQPNGIEDNGSRVANPYYQYAVDAQFKLWLERVFIPNIKGLTYIMIDFWDLERRKAVVKQYIEMAMLKKIQK